MIATPREMKVAGFVKVDGEWVEVNGRGSKQGRNGKWHEYVRLAATGAEVKVDDRSDVVTILAEEYDTERNCYVDSDKAEVAAELKAAMQFHADREKFQAEYEMPTVDQIETSIVTHKNGSHSHSVTFRGKTSKRKSKSHRYTHAIFVASLKSDGSVSHSVASWHKSKVNAENSTSRWTKWSGYKFMVVDLEANDSSKEYDEARETLNTIASIISGGGDEVSNLAAIREIVKAGN